MRHRNASIACAAAHFPAERNYLRAHLTLFHHLPAARKKESIRADLATLCAASGPLTLRATEVRFFGRGVAYGFVGAGTSRHGAMNSPGAWWPDLTAQDRRPFKPHVTVQNKVAPERARALYEALRADFAPFTITGTGLLLWRYRGGPWEEAGAYPFIGTDAV